MLAAQMGQTWVRVLRLSLHPSRHINWHGSPPATGQSPGLVIALTSMLKQIRRPVIPLHRLALRPLRLGAEHRARALRAECVVAYHDRRALQGAVAADAGGHSFTALFKRSAARHMAPPM